MRTLLTTLLAVLSLRCGDDKGGTATTTGAASTSASTGDPTDATTAQATTSTGSTTASSSTGDASTSSSTGDASTSSSTGDASTSSSTGDASSSSGGSSGGGGGLPEGAVCQDMPDACAQGLLCCYPCGIPDCLNKCIKPDPNTMQCPLFP